jgi:2-phosphosulfolactate phosphatase
MSKPKIDIALSPLLFDLHSTSEQIVVVIDVIRASTSICVALENGVKSIAPVSSIEEALALKNKGYITAGERGSYQLEGFDMGNSPHDFRDPAIRKMNLAMTTTNGTKAISCAGNSKEIVVGTFINSNAILNYLKSKNTDVLLLCAGWTGHVNIEDTLYAGMLAEQLLESKIFGSSSDSVSLAMELYKNAKAELFKFIIAASPRLAGKVSFLKEDIELCLTHNLIDIVPVLRDGHLTPYEPDH